MASATLASKTFDSDDQAFFARLSGDVNPMHMDDLAARRTQAGAAVVHGVHILLWSLEQLAQSGVSIAALSSLHVRFKKFVFLHHEVSLRFQYRRDDAIKLDIVADGLSCVS